MRAPPCFDAVDSPSIGGYHDTPMNDGQETKDYFRFCPGEEHIKISNAICRGRRNAHYPKCTSCRFNDDGAAPRNAQTKAREEQTQSVASVENAFRADDVCATVPTPLSDEVAWRIGHATGQYLRGKLRGYDRADPNARSVIVGRDMRADSARLQKAMIEGIRSAGMDVVNIGLIDTPQLYFAITRSGACGGVQTTGGRMGADHNGFIFCAAKAVPIGLDTGLASIRDIAARVPKHKTGITGHQTIQNLAQQYAEFIRGALHGRTKLPRSLKIVVDASNGMAGRWLPLIFKRIRGLTIVPLNFEHKGLFAHDPDPLVSKNCRDLRKSIKEVKADFGVCFDGDGSSCAFVDDKGISIPTDVMAALFARTFVEREPGASIVFDICSTRAIAEEVERTGGVAVPSHGTDTSIKKIMAQEDAAFGSDLSGRFYFRQNSYCESAFLAFVHAINLVAASDRKLGELARPLQRYRSSGEIRLPCPEPEHTLNAIARAYADAVVEEVGGMTFRYPDWQVHMRRDTREAALHVTLQARSKSIIEEKLAELRPLIASEA